MIERLTDRARKVMALANQMAQRFNHEYIGTEHLLLGLLKEGSGLGTLLLKESGLELRRIWIEVEKLLKSGPAMVTMGRLPQTPRTKKVIEYAIEEARSINCNYVGTEHLLLGLMREHDGVAAQVLLNLGLRLEELREKLITYYDAGQTDDNDVVSIAGADAPPQPPSDQGVAGVASVVVSQINRQQRFTEAVLSATKNSQIEPTDVSGKKFIFHQNPSLDPAIHSPCPFSSFVGAVAFTKEGNPQFFAAPGAILLGKATIQAITHIKDPEKGSSWILTLYTHSGELVASIPGNLAFVF